MAGLQDFGGFSSPMQLLQTALDAGLSYAEAQQLVKQIEEQNQRNRNADQEIRGGFNQRYQNAFGGDGNQFRSDSVFGRNPDGSPGPPPEAPGSQNIFNQGQPGQGGAGRFDPLGSLFSVPGRVGQQLQQNFGIGQPPQASQGSPASGNKPVGAAYASQAAARGKAAGRPGQGGGGPRGETIPGIANRQIQDTDALIAGFGNDFQNSISNPYSYNRSGIQGQIDANTAANNAQFGVNQAASAATGAGINQGFGNRQARGMGMTADLGKGQAALINQQFDQQGARVTQDLTNRGISASSAGAINRGVNERNRALSIGAHNDNINRLKLDTFGALSADTLRSRENQQGIADRFGNTGIDLARMGQADQTGFGADTVAGQLANNQNQFQGQQNMNLFGLSEQERLSRMPIEERDKLLAGFDEYVGGQNF